MDGLNRGEIGKNVQKKNDFDVDVFYNRVVIDGKSILGVLSMDLTKILNVRLHGENKEFEDFLETLVPMDEKIA